MPGDGRGIGRMHSLFFKPFVRLAAQLPVLGQDKGRFLKIYLPAAGTAAAAFELMHRRARTYQYQRE